MFFPVIARELGTTLPRVALAWVRSQPGVTSTIMGPHTMDHLEDNVQALGVTLTAAHLAALDAVSVSQLPFPIPFLRLAPGVYAGGTTINGEPSQILPALPQGHVLPTSNMQEAAPLCRHDPTRSGLMTRGHDGVAANQRLRYDVQRGPQSQTAVGVAGDVRTRMSERRV